MLFHDILRRVATRTPDRIAVQDIDTGATRTYRELYERAIRLGNGIRTLAGRGDRIAILSENSLEYVEAYYGIPAAGMALTMLNYRLHPKEWVWILNNARARVLLVAAPYYEAIAEYRDQLVTVTDIVVIGDPVDGVAGYESFTGPEHSAQPATDTTEDDIAWLLYTSGTTGFPKGAQLSHRNLVTAVVQSALEYELSEDTVYLNAMPLCHVAGYLVPTNLFKGGRVLMMAGWDPQRWMRTVQDNAVTSGGFAPTMMTMLLNHPKLAEYDLSSLRWMGYGASKIPVEVLRRTIEHFGPIVYAGMGMTELGGNILTLDRQAHIRAAHGEDHLLDAAGKPMALVDVRIVDTAGQECAVGEVGEMVIRGNQVMRGYFGNPEATAEAFEGGWFHTGDLARQDAEGFVYIVDRTKDMIISGGENIYPSEVENAIYTLADVAEAAVIGTPDPVWGERVTAVVVTRDGATVSPEQVAAACKDRLASFKQPREVVFVDELPKTVSGKIRKAELRARLADG
ncbi:class I adenylate-forming enzyme family protein [Nocardia sp. alder85J]|uniref:class I adenylate-forming enzyme family protein n=1 Tax=Nocardia sp. alder85J TaxID=2862949 RepID=UPI001CD4638F|nr:long-chain fatty acid--CoA ligase [Nocardia sp. alder85J]MCX4098526.1 long-chain fatty acid--CoA ligase [Nocardia sp. alder85J]